MLRESLLSSAKKPSADQIFYINHQPKILLEIISARTTFLILLLTYCSFLICFAFDIFNTCYNCPQGNRRGLGFDKPQLKNSSGPTCGCASISSFGHTGFTGTMTWADPENEMVYVFLSNRTFPNSKINKLSKTNLRENIQQVIYDAIIK